MIEFLIMKLSQASVLLPLIVGLRNYKFLDRPFRVFLILFVACALIELVAIIMKANGEVNMPAYNMTPFVEFYFTAWLYMQYFKDRKSYESLFVVSIAVFTAIAFLDLMVIHGLGIANTYTHGLESILLVVFSLLYFYDHFKKVEMMNVTEQPMFWVSACVLFYFSFHQPLFLLANYLNDNHPKVVDNAFTVHAIINIIVYIGYTKAYLCFRRTS